MKCIVNWNNAEKSWECSCLGSGFAMDGLSTGRPCMCGLIIKRYNRKFKKTIILNTAITLISLSAVLGMVLLTFVLQGKETPKGMAFSHGPLAVAGLILLMDYDQE